MAKGCLIKWNQQLLLVTIIVRDNPIKKLLVGASQRGAGQDIMTHNWRIKAKGTFLTVNYMINFGMSGFLGVLASSHHS